MSNTLFIKASSLIETVIAITIITLCSLIATMVYSSVINQTPAVKVYESQYELNKLVQETITYKNHTPFKKKYEGFTIEKRVFPNDLNLLLLDIHFIISTEKEIVKYSLLVNNEKAENEN